MSGTQQDTFGHLEGRRAVVTGSSSGLGRAIAIELARAGADVLVHARGRRNLAELVVEEIRALGRRSDLVLLDLEEPDNHAVLVERAWSWSTGVDIWVNNAGADVLTGSAANLPFEDKLERLWRVDVLGTVQISRLVGRRMMAADWDDGYACIVNMGWDRALTGMEGDSGEMFTAAKGAVMAFSRSLAQSLAPRVRVNCLAPGWIRTAWGESATEYWQQRVKRESLMQRWGTPEDVARVARFLASSSAEFVTGQVVVVNGGHQSGSSGAVF